MTEPPGGRFETFDANERFVVVRDEDGHAVRRLEKLGEVSRSNGSRMMTKATMPLRRRGRS